MNGLKNQNPLYIEIVEKIRKIRFDRLTREELADATYDQVFAYACCSVACRHCIDLIDSDLSAAVHEYNNIGINIRGITEIRGNEWCFKNYEILGNLFYKRFSRSIRTMFKYAGYPMPREFISKRKINLIDQSWNGG